MQSLSVCASRSGGWSRLQFYLFSEVVTLRRQLLEHPVKVRFKEAILALTTAMFTCKL
jgi:hypothetical protein